MEAYTSPSLMPGKKVQPNSTKKKACVACQINRRKCVGGRPCQRCAKLNVACIDRADRRRAAFRGKGRSGLKTVDPDMLESIALPTAEGVNGSASQSVGAQIARKAMLDAASSEKRHQRSTQRKMTSNSVAISKSVASKSELEVAERAEAAASLAQLGHLTIPASKANFGQADGGIQSLPGGILLDSTTQSSGLSRQSYGLPAVSPQVPSFSTPGQLPHNPMRTTVSAGMYPFTGGQADTGITSGGSALHRAYMGPPLIAPTRSGGVTMAASSSAMAQPAVGTWMHSQYIPAVSRQQVLSSLRVGGGFRSSGASPWTSDGGRQSSHSGVTWSGSSAEVRGLETAGGTLVQGGLEGSQSSMGVSARSLMAFGPSVGTSMGPGRMPGGAHRESTAPFGLSNGRSAVPSVRMQGIGVLGLNQNPVLVTDNGSVPPYPTLQAGETTASGSSAGDTKVSVASPNAGGLGLPIGAEGGRHSHVSLSLPLAASTRSAAGSTATAALTGSSHFGQRIWTAEEGNAYGKRRKAVKQHLMDDIGMGEKEEDQAVAGATTMDDFGGTESVSVVAMDEGQARELRRSFNVSSPAHPDSLIVPFRKGESSPLVSRIPSGLDLPKMLMQRDSRGTMRVLFSLTKGRASIAKFFKSRGYNWVWQGPRALGALEEQVLPGGVPELPPGATSRDAVKYLANRDASAASKLSDSQVACFRGVVDPETLQVSQGVMNAAAARAVSVGTDPTVQILSRSGMVSLPENMPTQALQSSSILLRGLLHRQKQIVYRLDVLRYTMCNKASGAACMCLVGIRQRLLQEQASIRDGMQDAHSASKAPSQTKMPASELLVQPTRLHGPGKAAKSDVAVAAFQDFHPATQVAPGQGHSKPMNAREDAKFGNSSSSSSSSSADQAASQPNGVDRTRLSERSKLVNEALDEISRFVTDRIICSRLKSNMAAVVEWLGSVPRAVTMILQPLEPPLAEEVARALPLGPASSMTAVELAQLVEAALADPTAGRALASFGDAPPGNAGRPVTVEVSPTQAATTSSCSAAALVAAAEDRQPKGARGDDRSVGSEEEPVSPSPRLGTKRSRSGSIDSLVSDSASIALEKRLDPTEAEDAAELAKQLGLPPADPVVEVIRDAFEFNVDPFGGGRAGAGVDLLHGSAGPWDDRPGSSRSMLDDDAADDDAEELGLFPQRSGTAFTGRMRGNGESSWQQAHIGGGTGSSGDSPKFVPVEQTEAAMTGPSDEMCAAASMAASDQPRLKRPRVQGTDHTSHHVDCKPNEGEVAGSGQASTKSKATGCAADSVNSGASVDPPSGPCSPIDSVGVESLPGKGCNAGFTVDSSSSSSSNSSSTSSELGSGSSGGEWSSLPSGGDSVQTAMKVFSKVASMSIVGGMQGQMAEGGRGARERDGGGSCPMERSGAGAHRPGQDAGREGLTARSLERLFDTRQALRVTEVLRFGHVFERAKRPPIEELYRVDEAVLQTAGCERDSFSRSKFGN